MTTKKRGWVKVEEGCRAAAPDHFWPMWSVALEAAPRLARFGEVFGRVRGVALPSAKEKGCLVDEDADQPAFEGSFAAEGWRIAGGGEATVFDGFFGFLGAVEDAACEEVKEAAAVGELQLEGVCRVFPIVFAVVFAMVLAGFAGDTVGFEVAAACGKAGVLDRFRGGGDEFWGGVGHKHDVFSLLLYRKYR
jgi:hypothetical protein